MEGLLAVVGLEVTTGGVRTGTGTERWRERVPDFRGHLSQPAINFSLFTKPSELSANESFFFKILNLHIYFLGRRKCCAKAFSFTFVARNVPCIRQFPWKSQIE